MTPPALLRPSPPLPDSSLLGKRVLVTCDNYFYAPTGVLYRAVYGTLRALQTSEESLGIKVSLRSQDWYLTVGRLRIAGCQIHYVIQTDECFTDRVTDWTEKDGNAYEYERPNPIYFAD